jgi:outer membrane protein OmpA-like peptidoglycan-associated protein
MRINDFNSHSTGSHTTTTGLMDLMTSLAIIFVLLLAASLAPQAAHDDPTDTPTPPQAAVPNPATPVTTNVHTLLHEHFAQFGLSVDEDAHDPLLVRIVIPEDLLNFEFGKSTLTTQADRFLTDMMPRYAALVCGPLESHVDSVEIEGHTDDRGDDTMNLRLSQERSFRVMTKGLEVIERVEPTVSPCFQRLTSASGRGRQDLIAHPATGVDRNKSRRVILKLRLRADSPHDLFPHTS